MAYIYHGARVDDHQSVTMQTVFPNTYNLSLLADVAVCDAMPRTDPAKLQIVRSLMLREVDRHQQLVILKSHLLRPSSHLSDIEVMRAVLLKYRAYTPTVQFALGFDDDPTCIDLPHVGGKLDPRKMIIVPTRTVSRGRHVVFRMHGLFDVVAFLLGPDVFRRPGFYIPVM